MIFSSFVMLSQESVWRCYESCSRFLDMNKQCVVRRIEAETFDKLYKLVELFTGAVRVGGVEKFIL